jgi:hypothetical protein
LTVRRIPFLTLLLAAASFAGACGNDSPTGPSDPGSSPVEITESLPPEPGTLAPNGGITHTSAVQQAGSITVTLSSLAPDSSAVIGVALGSWNGLSCAQTIVKDDATQGTSILGTATATGNYCVRVYDAGGSLAGPVQYQLTVRHF